jgi:hypothetical protein
MSGNCMYGLASYCSLHCFQICLFLLLTVWLHCLLLLHACIYCLLLLHVLHCSLHALLAIAALLVDMQLLAVVDLLLAVADLFLLIAEVAAHWPTMNPHESVGSAAAPVCGWLWSHGWSKTKSKVKWSRMEVWILDRNWE